MSVAEILHKKGRKVISVPPTTSIMDAVARMRREKVGALVVSSDGRKIQGIMSERDVLNGLASEGAALLEHKVLDIMTRRVECCGPEDDTKEIMATMTQRRFRHMPVVDENGLCGMISIGDIVKQRLEEAEIETNVAREALIFSR